MAIQHFLEWEFPWEELFATQYYIEHVFGNGVENVHSIPTSHFFHTNNVVIHIKSAKT